jgi:hypothetical protein
MPGALGMTVRTPTLDDAVAAHIAAEIRRYKVYREIVARASATLLSGQAPVDGGGWDVLQEIAVGSADIGPLGAASGASLMQDGVEVIQMDGSMAHVLVLRANQ